MKRKNSDSKFVTQADLKKALEKDRLEDKRMIDSVLIKHEKKLRAALIKKELKKRK